MDTTPLTAQDYTEAAQALECEPEVLMAIAAVETRGNGFQKQRDGSMAPTILFEKHIFSRLTGHCFDLTNPDLSHPRWMPGTYGSTLDQHPRLARAVKLDRDAALASCSWGKFQLMGCEWKENGYSSLQAFINAMYKSEREHLKGFVSFCMRKPGLQGAMVRKDWARIAYLYNGPGYFKNAYDKKMRNAYLGFKEGRYHV